MNLSSDFEQLIKKYSFGNATKNQFAFNDAYQKIIIDKKESLIDLIVAASNIGINSLYYTDPDPNLVTAFRRTNPNFDVSKLSQYSENELEGIINTSKGKYFEILVTEKLNNGEQVGDIYLPEGFRAVMAEKSNQPGWDVQILDSNGSVSEYLQLKATNSVGYIHDTLERYPDIAILSTDEVATELDGLVLNSGISEEEVRNQVTDLFDFFSSSFPSDIFTVFNPILPLVFILGTEGYRVSVGRYSIENAVTSSQYRIERSVAASGLGALVYALGAGWLSIPATFLGGELYNRYRESTLAEFSLEKATNRLIKYRLYQQQKLIQGGEYGFSN